MDSLYYQVWVVHFLCPLEDIPSPQMDETNASRETLLSIFGPFYLYL